MSLKLICLWSSDLVPNGRKTRNNKIAVGEGHNQSLKKTSHYTCYKDLRIFENELVLAQDVQ